MLFHSAPFLIFFPVVLIVYFGLPKRLRYIWLLIASYYFYMSWNPAYALLMLTSTSVTYLSGLMIARCRASAAKGRQHSPKLYVGLSFAINLGLLFFFKYYQFAAQGLAAAFASMGLRWQPPAFDVLLPVGISFYTFQALSYTMDVYRGDVPVERNFLRYALFVSFFPQLVAGPIERSGSLLAQLKEEHPFEPENFKAGALMMLWGYFQKMVIADRAAILVNQIYGHYTAYAGYSLIVATVFFAVQIYCDFSGYSAIAIGAAKILGIDLMQNFRQPYLAVSVADFWRRWHISLSTWFRDYLYIPLGGNRKGLARKYLNVLLTFLLSGLWHGANWTYVVWGGLNGLLQILGDGKNRLLKRLPQRPSKPLVRRDCYSYRMLQRIITFALICLTWVFFRAESLAQAMDIFRQIFSVHNPWIFFDETLYSLGLSRLELGILLVAICALLAVDIAHEHGVSLRDRLAEQNLVFRWLVYLAAIVFILVYGVYGVGYDASQFIYFQF
ncbi:MAG: MBOAT family protein [Clostridiales bacterium]|nr:MBOAT family protein [Clostridiales bacterium]MDO4350121.1 MBOAT family O-acyltransferase [Eubacteriales bacterium]MDY4008777.1 MBOAT family O-acyltransferase [Candidatus Limiplasma sp.]